VESVFVHVTAVPTATLSSAGTKALFPRNSARAGIMTDADCAPGAGVGDGAVGEVGIGTGASVGGEEESPPQAMTNMTEAVMTTRRKENIRSSTWPNLEAQADIPEGDRSRLEYSRAFHDLVSRSIE
jgi:hypothetical protein